MNKQRIQIYVDEQTKRRIRLAAAKNNMPISTYCLTAIQQQLEKDRIETTDQVTASERAQFQELIADIRELQETILKKRDS